MKDEEDLYKIHAPINSMDQQIASIDDYEVRKDKLLKFTEENDHTIVNNMTDVSICDEVRVSGKVIQPPIQSNYINQPRHKQAKYKNQVDYAINHISTSYIKSDVNVSHIYESNNPSINTLSISCELDDINEVEALIEKEHSKFTINNIKTIEEAVQKTNYLNTQLNVIQSGHTSANKCFVNKYNRALTQRFGRIGNTSVNILHNNHNTYDVNFIMAKSTYMATQSEIAEAKKHDDNKVLKHLDCTYLKNYVKLYGARFAGLYQEYIKLRREYIDIFAKRTYDRRTMNVPPVRLGIIDKFRQTQCYVPQYPLTPLKRRWMILYTMHNQQNGFWYKVNTSLHCMPHTMVPKVHPVTREILRYRPAFDARLLNSMCELYRSNMPTMKDFDDFHSIRGLFTMADIKNMFDNIPLHKDDQPWATVLTPLGLYRKNNNYLIIMFFMVVK